jgi:IS5 family transposase
MAKRTGRQYKRHKPSKRVRYRVRNWRAYERALVRRGEITLWFDRRLVKNWRPAKTGQRGAPPTYSAAVIVCMLTLKAVFHLANREVEGLVKSILKLMRVKLPTPDHTTVSRRGGRLRVALPVQAARGPVHLLLDSTGVQIFGPSAWREWQDQHWRQTQLGQQDFRKLHLALDADTQEIVAVEVTDQHEHDKEQVEPLLAQVPGAIARVTADGNYDFNSTREAIAARGARDVIPPRADAVIRPSQPRPERDQAVRRIALLGSRKAWKRESGYHVRSLIETTIYRLKARLGQRLRSREKTRQIQEVRIWCGVLNRMTRLGLPDSVPILTH